MKLQNFQTNELEVQKLSGVYETLKSFPNYNITEESKALNEYFFWVRPTSQWNCTSEEFKKTFDALDEASVQYESTRYYSTLLPMFYFGLLTFGFHTVMLIILIAKKFKNGKNSNKYYAIVKLLLVVGELICLIFFVVRSQDTIDQSTQHETQVELVAQNFDGRCTDENV